MQIIPSLQGWTRATCATGQEAARCLMLIPSIPGRRRETVPLLVEASDGAIRMALGVGGVRCRAARLKNPTRDRGVPSSKISLIWPILPLMELDYGKGRLIWCMLDLEDHVAEDDPVALRLAGQLMNYAENASLTPKARRTIYCGGVIGAKLVK